MKDLSIEVSSINNLVSNGDFELWNDNTPLNWTATNGDGTVAYANTLWGLGVQLTIPDDSASVTPNIETIIPSSSLTDGHSYTLGFWGKNDIGISIKEEDSTLIFGGSWGAETEWVFREINFQWETADGNITIQLYKGNLSNDDLLTCYYDNIYVYDASWYNDRLPLNINQIKNFENFQREIEDDLFTFKSDSLEFTIRNYGSVGSYFNTNDFETYSDRIFRFDITATYSDPDGDDIVKKMVMFSNNDTISKTRMPLTDDLTIQLYELSTLFKDNGWFLGSVVTDEENEETFFKYNTYNGTDPSIVANNVSVADTLSNLESDIRELIRRHFIPVPLNNFVINNDITNDNNTININYDWFIDEAPNRYIVLDAVTSPSGRVFLMLLLSDRIDENIGSNEITIWEVLNGSTITQLVTPNVTWSGSATGELGDQLSVGFIHDIDSTTYPNGSPVLFGFVQNMDTSSVVATKYKLYTDNSGTSIAGSGFNNTTEDDVKLYYIRDWLATTTQSVLSRNKCRSINSSGVTQVPSSYSADIDNMLWFSNVNNIFDGSEGTYTFSDTTLEGTNTWMTLDYTSTLDASIYRFPQYYSFIFKDAYPSDVLKDICVSQDAIWYLDYSTTHGNLTLTIKNRPVEVSNPATLNDNIALREDSFVRRIKFDDIDGTLFREDSTRLNYYLAYYNSTYGGGRFEKEFELRGYRDYALGDNVYYGGNYYFVKRFELYTNERKTLVTLFQKGG